MKNVQNVQIPQSLFYDLIRYFVLDSDDPELFGRIKAEVEAKVDKIVARELFTEYKTSDSPSEREKARKAYLDYKGISEAFRSPTEVKNEDL